MYIVFPMMGLRKSGGIRVLVEIANGLAKRGHRVRLLVSRFSDEYGFPLDPNIEIKHPKTKMGVLRELWWLMRNIPRDANVVVANFYLTAYPTAVATCLFQPIGYYLIQGYEPSFVSNPDRRYPNVQRIFARGSYYLPLSQITISNWLKDTLGEIIGRDVEVINDGVNTTVFSPNLAAKNRDANVIMALGSNALHKGFVDFLEAIQILVKQMPDLQLLIATQDKELVIDLPIPTEIIYPADDEELAMCYRRADVFVFPSLREGFGLPPLEAMACGTPVVTTNCGGVLDYAEDNVNCLITPVNDAQSMAEAIRNVVNDKNLSERLSKAGRETALRFSWNVMVDKFENLLTEKKDTD